MPCDKKKQAVAATVSLEVIEARRDVCRECDQATRTESKRDQPSKGLTVRSICLRVEAKHPGKSNIADGTRRADVTCDKWPN